jgi:fluoroquinolone transport system permease protein
LLKLIKGDLFFLARYGLFLVYAVFIVVYLVMLHYIPGETGTFVMKLLVFSDPAAMGLFFMGAVVLLEKSQRVNCSLAVSPVTTAQYTLSKSIAFLISGLAVGLIIAFGSGRYLTFWAIIGLAGGSLLFSMGGLFVATKTQSLNQFIICSLPVEIFISAPGFIFAFNKLSSPLWFIYPGVAAVNLLFKESDVMANVFSIISLVIWNVIVFAVTRKSVSKMFRQLGGGSL